jgi:hypothetical protein
MLDYEKYRFAYRSIGRSTDERTLICSIIPKKVFLGNSLNYLVNTGYKSEGNNSFIQTTVQPEDTLIILSLFNSLTMNYYIRNKISANLNMFYIYELPIPDVNDKQKKEIVYKSFQLLYHKSGKLLFDDLGKELGIKPEKKIDEIRVRAELEVLIARELYGLTKEEWSYITSTFIYGDESETKKELDEIIERSKEIFD